MGREALKSASGAVAVAAYRYPTPSSGYAKQIAPLLRPQSKPGGLFMGYGQAAYGLGASCPTLPAL